MTTNKKLITILFLWLTLVFLPAAPVMSCNVPVFRYALERWPADAYEVFVFFRGHLSPEDAAVVEWLENSAGINITGANYTVQVVDLSSDAHPRLIELWKTLDNPELPCLALRYPASLRYMPAIWSVRLTMDNAKALVDSPVRQEIAGRILDGESAVWILLESGDNAGDDDAAQLIESQLSNMGETLRLPGEVAGNAAFTPVDITNGPELRIAFSLIRLSKKDPAESVLIAMLKHSEPDLFEYESYPMVFPVYGRGRALYSLIGGGISERNIRGACEFITGACSCEVKALNPGIDLLIAADWEAGIMDSWIADINLPPLVGLSELVQVSGAGDSTGTVKTPEPAGGRSESDSAVETGNLRTDTAGQSGHLMRNILFALGAIIAVITLLSLKIGRIKDKG